MASSEEFELPCKIDDFPNYHLKNEDEHEILDTNKASKIKEANNYLETLEQTLRTTWKTPKDRISVVDKSLDLYEVRFNKVLANQCFNDQAFPSAEELEEQFNAEYDLTTKLLYNETCNRHSFSKLFNNQFNFEIASSSWENYQMLFDAIKENKSNQDLPIPHTWIWDMLDEYVYQFYLTSRWRKGLKKEDFKAIKDNDKLQDFWNLEELVQTLQGLIEVSSVKNLNVPLNQLKTIHYFGFFALLALSKVYVMITEYNKALEQLSSISYDYLIVYSKSGGAYINLFTQFGLCYLMMGKYKQSLVLFKVILNFFAKYRQFYSKSFQYDLLNKNFEKTTALLAITLLFYPESVDETIRELFSEVRIKKDRSQTVTYESLYEKYQKLILYDQHAFSELFYFSFPKIVTPIKSKDDFQQASDESGLNDLLNEQKDRLLSQLQQVKQLNHISSILQLYDKLNLDKMARLLEISQNELNDLLNRYKDRNQSSSNSTPFEETILSKCMNKSTLVDFTLDNGIITINHQKFDQLSFGDVMSKYNSQVLKTLEKLNTMIP